MNMCVMLLIIQSKADVSFDRDQPPLVAIQCYVRKHTCIYTLADPPHVYNKFGGVLQTAEACACVHQHTGARAGGVHGSAQLVPAR